MSPLSRQEYRRRLSPEARERERQSSIAWKRRQRGRCVDCGAETKYAGNGKRVSERCVECGRPYGRERLREAVLGRGHLQQAILAALSETEPIRYMDIRAATGIPDDKLGQTLIRMVRYGLIARPARGRYLRTSDGSSTMQPLSSRLSTKEA